MGDIEASFQQSLQTFRDGTSSTGSSLLKFASQVQQGMTSAVTSTVSRLQPASDSLPTVSSTISSGTQWGMSQVQRMVLLAALVVSALACFLMAFFALPFVIIMPGKFALSFTVGSVLSMAAMAVYTGPMAYLSAMLSAERFTFTMVYVISILATLYASLLIKSYFLCIIFAALQLAALAWYVASYLPGGTSALNGLVQGAMRGIRGVVSLCMPRR